MSSPYDSGKVQEQEALALAADTKPKLVILGQARPAPERKDAAKNRIRILETARTLLQTRPIHSICMDELAKCAGVGKGTLYRRFEDRASLCRALLHEDAIRLQNEVLSGFGVPHDAPSLVHLTNLIDALFDFAADHAQLLSEAHAFERGGTKRFDHPAHAWQRDAIARYLERAVARNEIEPIDSIIAAEMILAALDPDLLRWHLGRGTSKSVVKDHLRTLWRSMVVGTDRGSCAY